MKIIQKNSYFLFAVLFVISFITFFFLCAEAKALALQDQRKGVDEKLKNRKDFLFIKADFIEKKSDEEDIFYLKENVVFSFKDYLISGKEAKINFKTYEIEAKGNVLFKFSKNQMLADKIFFNYSTFLGHLYNVQFQFGKISISGKTMEKVSDKEYILEDAKFTFCTNCPPLLSFSSPKLKIQLGDSISAYHPLARIYDKPFFYFPYVAYPLNVGEKKRKSGFLFPQIDIIDLGFIFSQGLFLSLSDYQDLTLTGRYYSERGLKFHTHYQYKKSSEKYGIFKGALIKDRVFNSRFKFDEKGLEKRNTFRGFLQYKQRFSLPFDWKQKTNLNLITDLHYNRDYPDELRFHGDSALENQVSLMKNLDFQYVGFELGWYKNLLKTNPFEKNTDAVHRLPEINYSWLTRRIGSTPFYYNFHFNYVHFFREHSAYDDVIGEGENKLIGETRDGFFNFYRFRKDKGLNLSHREGPSYFQAADFSDQIRTGHRMILHPNLFYFVSLFKKVNFMSSLSYKERLYLFNVPKSQLSYEASSSTLNVEEKKSNQEDLETHHSQKYSNYAGQRNLDLIFSAKTKFYKIFHLLGTKYKHVFEPEVSLSDTLWLKTSRHSFFGKFETLPLSQRLVPVSNVDFFSKNKGIQFDYEDRLYDHTFLNFLLIHKLVQKSIKNGEVEYNTFFTLRTEQSYDLSKHEKIKPQSWSPMKNTLLLSFDRVHFQHIWDYFPYVNVHHWDSRLQLDWSKRQWLGFSYKRAFVIKEDNTYNFDERTENIMGSLGFTSRYLDFEGHLTYSLVNQLFQRWSYLIVFKPPGDCVHFKFQQIKDVGVKAPYFTFKLNLKI